MHPFPVTVCVVVVVAETGYVPRVPVEELNLGHIAIFSDGSCNAEGAGGREGSNRCSVLLPDDSGEYLMRIGLVQVDEDGAAPAIVGGAFASDVAAHGCFVADVVNGLGGRYRLTVADGNRKDCH